MKYEPVFGDQSLFDGAPDGAEMVGGLLDRCRLFYKIVGGDLYASFGTHDNFTKEQTTTPKDIKVSAMRRIIAEPNRWTVEDQEAGRLPEVGSEVILRTSGEIATINAANKNMVCLTFSDGGFSPFNVERIDPIESPEEKAQREEDEWVNKAWGETAVFAGVAQDEHDRLRIHLRHIYKAQLSGELQAPKGGER